MPEVTDGMTYADWKTEATSQDSTMRLGSEYAMVVLYDAAGRPQRVRGSAVASMLAKCGGDGLPVFFGQAAG
jgi:hypothetical protein